MKKEIFHFPSSFEGKQIYGIIYKPDIPAEEIKGLVQVIHGFAEYVGRYDSFMSWLANQGYVVVGDDHLGHGETAKDNNMLMTDVGSYEAFDHLLKDEWQLNQIIRQKFLEDYQGDLPPIIILGHSMGSLMLRALLIQHPDICDKAIIMGTGDMGPGLLKFFAGLLKLASAFHQGSYQSKLINFMGIDMNNTKFKSEGNKNAWLSANVENTLAYNKDPLAGNPGSLHTFAFIQKLMSFIRIEDELRKMKKDLPILFVSGQEDAFGDFGKGVQTVYHLFEKAGMSNLNLKLYPNMRHEILNEKDNQEVLKDILDFIKA